MALIDKLTAIANAIREKTGITEPMTLDEMAEIILTMGVDSGSTSVFAPLYEKFSIDKAEYPIVGISYVSNYVSLCICKEIVANTDGTYKLAYGYSKSNYDDAMGLVTLEDAINTCITFSSLNNNTSSANVVTLRQDRTCYSNAPIVKGSFVNYVE